MHKLTRIVIIVLLSLVGFSNIVGCQNTQNHKKDEVSIFLVSKDENDVNKDNIKNISLESTPLVTSENKEGCKLGTFDNKKAVYVDTRYWDNKLLGYNNRHFVIIVNDERVFLGKIGSRASSTLEIFSLYSGDDNIKWFRINDN